MHAEMTKLAAFSALRGTLVVIIVSMGIANICGQVCDDQGVAYLFGDIMTQAASSTADGAVAVGGTQVDLTTAVAGSFGGFFLSTPTNFQGPGGFSASFSIQNTGTVGRGGAWEFVIAESGSRTIAAPPYGPGETSNGVAGWSRLNALVIELDSRNSGSSEEDDSADHIDVFLSGTKQNACGLELTGESFASGDPFIIWIDFSGYNTKLEIRHGTDENRPSAASVSCSVDIWSTLSISASNFIGLMAYNDDSTDSEASTMSLVGSLYLVDAYRPDGSDSVCEYYDTCSPKTVSGLCTPTNIESTSTCTLEECSTSYIWDASSTTCCAFVERVAWQATDSTASRAAGDQVDCAQPRTTIVSLTDNLSCGISERNLVETELEIRTPGNHSSLCSVVCQALLEELTCSSTESDIAQAQATTCTDDTTMAETSCACTEITDPVLSAMDESDSVDASTCIANTVSVSKDVYLGSMSNMYIFKMTTSGVLHFNKSVIDSKLCVLQANLGFEISPNTYSNVEFHTVTSLAGGMSIASGATISNTVFGHLLLQESLVFDKERLGGSISLENTHFDSMYMRSCYISTEAPPSRNDVTLETHGSTVGIQSIRELDTNECDKTGSLLFA